METYLIHSRTKGSKNGERKYQNEDGTYTELGKERRRKGGDLYRGPEESGGTSGIRLKSPEEIEAKQRKGILQYQTTKEQKDQAPIEDINSNKITAGDVRSLFLEVNKAANSGKGIGVAIGKSKDDKINRERVAEARKKLEDISDEDLQKINKRLNLERNYIDLTAPATHANEERARRVFDYIVGVSTVLASAAGIAATIHTLKK